MENKQKLIEAAENLFAEKGFAETSIRDVSREADVNLAMIGYYFDSKQGLLEEVIRERNRKRLKAISQVVSVEDSTNIQVYKILSYITKNFFDNRKLYVLITRELSIAGNIGKDISDVLSSDIDKIKQVLDRNVTQTYNVDTEMLVITMFSTVNTIINIPKLFYRFFGFESVDEMFDPLNYKKVTYEITNHLFQIYLNSIVEESE